MTVTRSQIREIRLRAVNCCEYCLLHENIQSITFHIDHVFPVTHGGNDSSDNLCLACPDCNRFKGPIVAALDPLTEEPTRLYNPRGQDWDDHFELNADVSIAGLTPPDRNTVTALRMNMERRIIERYEAWIRGEYPCLPA